MIAIEPTTFSLDHAPVVRGGAGVYACLAMRRRRAPAIRSRERTAGVRNAALTRLPPPAPSPAPSAAPAATADETYDEEQDYRADGGIDDRRNDANAEVDAELRKQPTADERADNSNNQITNQPKTGPSHDLTGQPAGNDAYQQYDQETFARHVHSRTLRV